MHIRPLPHYPAKLYLVAVLVCLVASPCRGAPDTEEASSLESLMDRWIALERRTADERNQWRSEKELLEASIEVLQKEQAALHEKAEANTLAASLFKTRLDQVEADTETQETAHAQLNGGWDKIEARIRALTPRLPEPLREKLQPVLDRLSAAPAGGSSSISERTQAFISILTSIDQFNNTLTLRHQLREGSDGRTIDVRVIYWGLAVGYALDGSTRQAWIITPGADGWTWNASDGDAAAIQALMDIHEKQRSPELVTLPVATRGGAR